MKKNHENTPVSPWTPVYVLLKETRIKVFLIAAFTEQATALERARVANNRVHNTAKYTVEMCDLFTY